MELGIRITFNLNTIEVPLLTKNPSIYSTIY